MKHVYMIVDDTACYGVWSNPREAARRWLGYRKERDPDMGAESLIQAKITKELKRLMDGSDNPMLIKVPVDPAEAPLSVELEGNILIFNRRFLCVE